MDSEEDEKEVLEVKGWRMEEELSQTWMWRIRETMLLTSMTSTMLAICAHMNCNIHVVD